MVERRQDPLRIAIFAEGSRSPREARVDYFEQIWLERLPALVGRPAPALVFPIDKASIEAMNPASPKSTGRGEALDDRIRRELIKAPFDCVIVAWDLQPSLASAMTPPQCRWNETLRLYEGLAREGSMLPPEWLKFARAKVPTPPRAHAHDRCVWRVATPSRSRRSPRQRRSVAQPLQLVERRTESSMPLRLLAFLLTTLSPAVAQAAEVTGDSGKGLTVTSDDGQFSMNVRGRIQLRESLTTPPPGDGAREFTTIGRVSTARVWLNGHTLSEDIGYTFQLAVAPNDYRDGTISPIFDAYLDLSHNPNASLRVGQIFVPFDRARTIREFSLQLADRPRPVSELTLDRDVGAYLYSDALGGSMVAYRLGVFAGGGGNAVAEKAPGGLAVARSSFGPWAPSMTTAKGISTAGRPRASPWASPPPTTSTPTAPAAPRPRPTA
jgi:hypothetical protein